MTTYFKHFVFMELFDLKSNPNSLFEMSSIKDTVNFLFDLVMYFCIYPISTTVLKFYLAGLILLNSQPSSFSIAFCLSIS